MDGIKTQTQDTFYTGFSTEDWVRAHLKEREGMSSKRVAVEFQCTYLTRGTLQRIRKILDAGCGAGYLSQYLAASSQKIKCFGFDISVPVLRIAQKRTPSHQFLSGDILCLPFVTNTFDLCYSRDVLIHHARPFEAIAELYRVAPHVLLRIRTAEIPSLFTAHYKGTDLIHQFFSLPETLQRLCSLYPTPRTIRYKVHVRYPRQYASKTFLNHGGFQTYFVTDTLITKGNGGISQPQVKDDTTHSFLERALQRTTCNRSWL